MIGQPGAFASQVYEKAALVRDCVHEGLHFIEMGWDDHRVVRSLHAFSKPSLLGHYIFGVISVEARRDYRKNSDLLDMDDISSIENLFGVYGISIGSFAEFALGKGVDPVRDSQECDLAELIYSWFTEEEDQFEELWSAITDEVFHLLFANRPFLLEFNTELAEFLSSGQVNIPDSYLDRRGRLYRQSHIPSWAKKAVYCRDKGRCAICQKDLSGLLSTDRNAHYDHIVPLKRFGVNDPCNLQLLCDDCNRRKSGGVPKTSARYSPWW